MPWCQNAAADHKHMAAVPTTDKVSLNTAWRGSARHQFSATRLISSAVIQIDRSLTIPATRPYTHGINHFAISDNTTGSIDDKGEWQQSRSVIAIISADNYKIGAGWRLDFLFSRCSQLFRVSEDAFRRRCFHRAHHRLYAETYAPVFRAPQSATKRPADHQSGARTARAKALINRASGTSKSVLKRNAFATAPDHPGSPAQRGHRPPVCIQSQCPQYTGCLLAYILVIQQRYHPVQLRYHRVVRVNLPPAAGVSFLLLINESLLLLGLSIIIRLLLKIVLRLLRCFYPHPRTVERHPTG